MQACDTAYIQRRCYTMLLYVINTFMQVKTASISNPEHYVNIARKLASDTPGAVFMDQFESEANFKVTYQLILDATTMVVNLRATHTPAHLYDHEYCMNLNTRDPTYCCY
jgi:hypothetical protein